MLTLIVKLLAAVTTIWIVWAFDGWLLRKLGIPFTPELKMVAVTSAITTILLIEWRDYRRRS